MDIDAEDVARAVLAKAAAIDNRLPPPDLAVIAAWTEQLQQLTPADALTAVTEHYATETRRIMPADVRRIATRLANERHDRNRLAELTAGPANPAAQRRAAELVRTIYRNQRGFEPDDGDPARREAMTVACPWPTCRAAVGEACKGPGGRPLLQSPAHDARIQAAAKQRTAS